MQVAQRAQMIRSFWMNCRANISTRCVIKLRRFVIKIMLIQLWKERRKTFWALFKYLWREIIFIGNARRFYLLFFSSSGNEGILECGAGNLHGSTIYIEIPHKRLPSEGKTPINHHPNTVSRISTQVDLRIEQKIKLMMKISVSNFYFHLTPEANKFMISSAEISPID